MCAIYFCTQYLLADQAAFCVSNLLLHATSFVNNVDLTSSKTSALHRKPCFCHIADAEMSTCWHPHQWNIRNVSSAMLLFEELCHRPRFICNVAGADMSTCWHPHQLNIRNLGVKFRHSSKPTFLNKCWYNDKTMFILCYLNIMFS